MAWVCPRCEKKIFAPRDDAYKYVFSWKYVKKTGDLFVELKNLRVVRPSAVITHMHCPTGEKPGFKSRIRGMLEMPEHRDHPLLI